MMDMYALSRGFWDYAFENPDKIKPNHCALFFFAIEHCNRLGWKEKFGLPTTMVMEAIGVKSYNTYINTFNDLVNWGLIIVHERSKNQYSSNIIEVSKFEKAINKALDKALIKHVTKQSESTQQSTQQSIDSINIQYTNIQNTNIQQTDVFEIDSEEIQRLTKEIASYFNLSEIHHAKHYMRVGNFCRLMESKGSMDYLKKQFYAYRDFKNKNGFKHSWESYLGSPEKSYEDGAWNKKDWSKEGTTTSNIITMPKRNRNPQ